MLDWLKKAPTSVVVTVIIVCGVIAVAVLGCFVALQLSGADTADFRQWIQTVGILVLGSLTGVNTVASVAAARSSSNTEDQTNGTLTKRDDEIADLRAQVAKLAAVNGPEHIA